MIARLFDANLGTIVRRIGLTTAFVVAVMALLLAVIQPTRAAVTPQGNMPHDDDTTLTPNPMGSGMMNGGMMGSGMMGSSSSVSPTVTLAHEAGVMMDDMSAMMAAMPVSGTLSMGDMETMMQMMAMMHQHMAAMHMMAGGMMGSGMMMEMPCADSTTMSAPPAAAQADNAPADAVPSESAEATESRDAIHPPLVANPVRQSGEAGAVTVEVMPLPPSDPLEVAFEVVMDTHSVDLGFDLAPRATLTLDDEAFVATAWEPDVPSGHHISGILRFTIDETTHAAFADAGMVTLELANIDGETLSFVYTVAVE